jgi:chemotaxis protein histidine kinase CheA/ActR/RegA family two-component response regulator
MPTAQQKYLEMFLEEGSDILAHLNSRVLALEGQVDFRSTIQSALRHAHTLKGGARMVGLNNLSNAAHDLETSLKELAVGDQPPAKAEVDRFLALLDRMGQLLDLIAAGRTTEAGSWDLLVEDAPGRPVPGPVSVPPGDGPASRGGPPPPEPEKRAGADRLRVSVEKLDELQNLVDDLTLHKSRIVEMMRRFKKAAAGLEPLLLDEPGAVSGDEQTGRVRDLLQLLAGKDFTAYLEEFHTLEQLVSELQEQVFDLRMVPLLEVFDAYQRIVRDLAQELGKEIALVIDGRFTEIDKRLLEALRGPLMHLVRNAVDHGIETPAERSEAGKAATGTLTIRAYHRGSAVVIEVEDDGRGLDPEEIRRKAVQRGVVAQDTAAGLSPQEVLYLLSEPGFSTRDTVTEVSGRGVGLDAVKVRLEKLKGSLVIQSERGAYTRFKLYLPLSVSSLSTLVVGAGAGSVAIPSTFVDRCWKVDVAQLDASNGRWDLGDHSLTAVSLAQALGVDRGSNNGRTSLVLIRFRGRPMLLQVDRLEEESEVFLKPLGKHLRETPYVTGVAFLSDGRPAPVLNVPDLHARWTSLEEECFFRSPPAGRPRVVLVVDDSLTTRHMEANILETLGYSVLQAADGEEAWSILEREVVDLVLTDIEMPRLDGLALSRRVRQSTALAHLPLVAVSYRGEDADVRAGYQAGVDTYIHKDRFSQRVLAETIRDLLTRRSAAAGSEGPL